MVHRYAEPAFDLLVALATGLAAVSYLLGLFLPPQHALLVGGSLVMAGTVTLVPRGTRLLAGTFGLTAVLIGGGVVPVVVARLARPEWVPELVTLAAGSVLLTTFAVLYLTTFDREIRPTA